MSNPSSRSHHLTTGICVIDVFVSDSDQNRRLERRPECDSPHGMEKSVPNDSMARGQCVFRDYGAHDYKIRSAKSVRWNERLLVKSQTALCSITTNPAPHC